MGVLATMQPRSDQAQSMPQGQASDTDGITPGFGATIAAAYRAGKDELPNIQQDRLTDAYGDLVNDLSRSTGVPAYRFRRPFAGRADMMGAGDPWKVEDIWSAINAARAQNPKAFAAAGKDQAEFEQRILTRQGGRAADVATAGKGNMAAQFIGGFGAGLHDPLNWLGMAAGGGAGVGFARGLLNSAASNAVVAAASEPGRIMARKAMGEDTTLGEAARDVGMAAVLGAGLHGATVGAGKAIRAGIDAIPLETRGALALKLANPMAADLDSVARAFEERTPEHYRTPDEAAALNVIRRAADDAAVNPYEPTYAGADLHQARLGQATERLVTGTARELTGWAKDARSQFKDRLRAAESGGNDMAANGLSSAAGRYQFTDATWLRLFKERFGDTGQSKADILGKKFDAASQEVVMDHALGRYEKSLNDAGQPVTAANLYLEHFAGEGGAKRLLRAEGDVSAESVLGAKVVEANPWMRGMSVDDLKAWAARKMGGRDAAMPMAGSDDMAGELATARADQASAQAADVEIGMMDAAAMAAHDGGAPEPIMGAEAQAPQQMPRLQESLFDTPEAHRAAQAVADADALGEGIDAAPPSTDLQIQVSEGSYGFVYFKVMGAKGDVPYESPGGFGGIEEKFAGLAMLDRGDHFLVKNVGLPDNLRGTGTALRLYEDAINYAFKQGKFLTSSETISNGAASNYRKLVDRYQVTENLSRLAPAEEVGYPTSRLHNDEGEPIFTVKPKTSDAMAIDLATPAADVGAEPTGAAAQVQADGLLHDVRGDVEAGKLDGLTFALGEDGEAISAAQALARLDDDQAALDALKGCL